MKLGDIYQTASSWHALSAMKMQPQMAHKIMKYARLVFQEYDLIEKQRIAIVREITGTNSGQEARIEPDTVQFNEYVRRFNEVLNVESELKPFGDELDSVLDSLGKSQENLLSVRDLVLLEPFFIQ